MNQLLKRRFIVSPNLNVETKFLGSSYGGWSISPGYLDSSSVVYSVGVGEDVSFDLGLIEMFGMEIHAFDPTPKSIEWVKRQSLPSEFKLHEFGLAEIDGELSFFPPVESEHVSYSIHAPSALLNRKPIAFPVKRWSTIVNELQHSKIDLLKMDIEGAEYGVIEQIAKSSVLPRQLLVEFHHRFENLGPRASYRAHLTLREAGYNLFAVSASGDELSYLRN